MQVWGDIKHMIAKSLVAVQPILQYNYASAAKPDDDGFSCFEVTGMRQGREGYAGCILFDWRGRAA